MMSITNFQSAIVYLPIGALSARPDNARTHSKRQHRAIVRSLRQFGFTNPVLVDNRGRIIRGHARVEAARELGLTSVPTITLGHLNEKALTAYMIADNRLSELGGWDKEKLSINLADLSEDATFDLTITGFDDEEIDRLHDLPRRGTAVSEPELPAPDRTKPATSRVGDLWNIEGGHRLICQNARNWTAYKMLLDGQRADLAITDPPFNVPVRGHVSGLGKNKHREFVMASGEMSRPEFIRFMGDFMQQMARATRSGSVHYIFMDWRSIADLITAGEGVYNRLLNLVVWNKGSGSMGSFYRSQHELIAVFCNGKRPHINNVELGVNGRNRCNLWTYPGLATFSATRADDLARHPTVKNQAMIADAIRDASERGDLVLDVFAGSGTCLFAAHETGRHARLIELDPIYVDLIVNRAQDAGLAVTLEATGEPLATVIDRRQNETASHDLTGAL